MSIRFAHRSTGIEIMDDLDCRGEVVDQTLRELDFINHWLGGNAVTLNGLQSVWKTIPKAQKTSIVDLGCGSGEMLRLIAKRTTKSGRQVDLIGLDANPNITLYAQTHSCGFENIKIETVNIFSEGFRQRKFDIVLATLFLHHFTEEELIGILASLKNQVRYGIIINDIHRHPLAFYSIKLLTMLFSKSAMVKFDAPLSVLRAFKKTELINILHRAGIAHYQLKWKWAFRWQLIIRR
jgi:2-polyprenyl-3-methyl-5-hydroxy-6-metoxy-1,4-benzoquinol methylase